MKPKNSIEEYESLLNKVINGNTEGKTLAEFYDNIIDSYLDGIIFQKNSHLANRFLSK